MAEHVLEIFFQKKKSVKTRLGKVEMFFMEQPQYLYAVCIHIASKSIDPTYCDPKIYLRVCQKEAESLYILKVIKSENFFNRSVFDDEYVQVELVILKSINFKVTSCP